jgi:hypothetical protein
VTTESWGTLARAESNDKALLNIEKIVKPSPKEAPDFDKEVLLPLRAKQAEEAEQARLAEEARVAEEARQVAQAAQQATVSEPSQPVVPAREVQQGELAGLLGYAIPYGNCVNEPGVNNPGWGNPINWPASSYSPWIGASALFGYNHVAVVTGIWSNGDIEVRHQNFRGNQTRFPRSAFRGFR